jgi:hypothetical protein
VISEKLPNHFFITPKENFEIKKKFLISPKITRLYNQREYTAEKTILVAKMTETLELKEKKEINTKISPTKPLVPGNPILLKIKIKKIIEKIGITLTNPP